FLPVHTPPPSVIYTLTLHDALPICSLHRHFATSPTPAGRVREWQDHFCSRRPPPYIAAPFLPTVHLREPCDRAVPSNRPAICQIDRKSTRLNSSHRTISYAVFCLKK